MNPDGTSITRLTDPGRNYDPSWSPDGSRIAFVGFAPYNFEIYSMNADGGDRVNLTNDAETDTEPDWSPDGKNIAFMSTRGGAWHVWVMDADGANVHRLTTSPSSEAQPAWSPDGASIAFTSDRDEMTYELYSVNPDGSHLRRLTTNKTGDSAPAWSPDGSKIVFVRYPALYIMNADGSNESQLTISATDWESDPGWSPDGRKIVFTRGSDLYEIDANGSNEHNLTNTPGAIEDRADWQALEPLPRCLVPKVIGLRLATARVRIRRARCTVGRVRRAQSRRAGRVLTQNPRAGAQRPVGSRVNLLVGRR